MPKTTIKTFLSIVVIAFTFTNSALAWDDTGHKLTAYIAWERMTPAVREKAFKILMSAPEDSDLNVFYLQDSRSEAVKKMELFEIAATWADIVRDRNFKVRYGKYHKGNWHYADTFWSGGSGEPVKILPNPAGEEGGQAIVKLAEFGKVLKDAAASDADKAIALAWFLHLAGDIHQPLHTSGRVTASEPKGDQGGNLFQLTPAGTPRDQSLNLHWFWDSIIGRNIPRQNDACDYDYLPAIAKDIMTKYPFAKMQNRLKGDDFKAWQDDSFKLATTKVFPASLKRNETPTDAYKKQAFDISEEELALAGYRMGEVLNQILAQ